MFPLGLDPAGPCLAGMPGAMPDPSLASIRKGVMVVVVVQDAVERATGRGFAPDLLLPSSMPG